MKGSSAVCRRGGHWRLGERSTLASSTPLPSRLTPPRHRGQLATEGWIRNSESPPIVHRKEQFVDVGHPARQRFTRLTAQEERLGLLAEPEVIGTRQGWCEVLVF